MFKSKEIRWFSMHRHEGIVQWFGRESQTFETTNLRTDFYLPFDKKDITVKLREGNIEIKHRVSDPSKGYLTRLIAGMFEDWAKWSFNVDRADKLSQEIIQLNKNIWTKVTKTRLGVK